MKRIVALLVVGFASSAQAAPPRQVVQAGPTGAMAISKSGYAAVIDKSNGVHFYDLTSRTLVRSIPSSKLNDDGNGLVNPVVPVWDDTTNELVLPRGNDLLGIAVDGTLTPRPVSASRVWPAGKGRWISRAFGVAELRDASWKPLGKLDQSDAILAAGDGKTALLVTKEGQLQRYTLAPFAKTHALALPGTLDRMVTGHPIALTADGTTAAICVVKPGKGFSSEFQVAIVRGLDKQPVVTPLAYTGSLIGCDVSLAEAHDMLVVASTGEVRGYQLSTGTLRWQAPRSYDVQMQIGESDVAVHGKSVVVSWRGLLTLDLVRGDVTGQIGTDIARPEQLGFLRGEQLLAVRQQPASIFKPTGVALSIWSLKDGSRTASGGAMWGSVSRLGEDGSLVTARQAADRSCWTFSKGTTADGAPSSKDPAKGAWPPAPNKSVQTCLAKPMSIAGIDLATGSVAVYDTNEHRVITRAGTQVTLKETPRFALSLEFSPDGAWVMGSNQRGSWASLDVWDVRTGTRRYFAASAKDPDRTITIGGTTKGYWAHAITADSKQIAVAGSDQVTVYALASRQPIRTFTVPNAALTSVAITPTVVVAGTSDGRLVVSRAGAASGIASSDGGAITQIAIRSDSRRAATVSADGAIRLWDLAKPALLVTLVEATDGEAFASTPGGAYVGGREAAEQLGWIFDGPTEGFRFERFAGQLARPDIVAKRLADATTELAVAIARPPRVTVLKQPPPAGNTVKLEVRAEAGTGKVASLRAFVNGRASSSVTVDAPTKDVAIDIPLEAGSNVVTLVAFDEAGRSSNPRSVEVGTALSTARPDVWVIAAGVGWYPNLPVEDQLEGSVNDASAVADAFAGQAGPGKRYDRAHLTVLEDEQVTAAALDKALAELAQMKPTDVAVVFLAGHGVRLPKTEDMVLLTGAATLDKTTWAGAGIGWTRIGSALAKAKGRVIVLLDACHAGNVTQERIIPNTQLAEDLVSSQRAGVLVFAASKGSQKSLEANAARAVTLDDDQKVLVQHKRVPKKPPPPATPTAPRERRGNGFFTGAVVAALDSPVTDINRDGVIQTAELITQVQLRVLRASHGAQTPWVARRELFGDFALATAAK